MGTPASCATAHTGSSSTWLGACVGGQALATMSAAAPASTASRAMTTASARSASGT